MLVGVLLAVMASFVIATIVAQQTSAAISTRAESIVSQAMPSISSLASLRGSVLQIEVDLSLHLQRNEAPTAEREAALEAQLARFREQVQAYLALEVFPSEVSHWRKLQHALVRFEAAAQRTLKLAGEGKPGEAREVLSARVDPAARQVIDVAMRTIEINARESRVRALQIREAHQRAVGIENLLTLLSIGLGTGGAFLVLRQNRRQRELVAAHSHHLEERAAELEQFAGRVAHDIRNPLGIAKAATEVAMQRSDREGRELVLERALRGLSGAEAITNDLLEFARSGAQPDPGARASPRRVLADIATGVAPEARQLGIDVRFESVPPFLVVCSPGVYMSLAGNLIRNAMRHTAGSDDRRIVVRVRAEGRMARTEVTDTGPGVPAEELASLFNPYFRGRVGRSGDGLGLGLGLATVKRLAEAHEGDVGVTSEPGKGSTFWFRLPRAEPGWDLPDVEHSHRELDSKPGSAYDLQ